MKPPACPPPCSQFLFVLVLVLVCPPRSQTLFGNAIVPGNSCFVAAPLCRGAPSRGDLAPRPPQPFLPGLSLHPPPSLRPAVAGLRLGRPKIERRALRPSPMPYPI